MVIDVDPGRIQSPGPTGLSRFRHPAGIAVDDLLYLSVAISDNTAADALFELVPPARAHSAMADVGISGIRRATSWSRQPSDSSRPTCTSRTRSPSVPARRAALTRYRNWT
jgi:beta-lactamase class A